MTDVGRVARVLDEMVATGQLVGYVCGVRSRGASEIVAGGSSSIGGPELSEEAVFPLSSNTKPLGGVLAMRLVELGVIHPDQPVAEFLPELADLKVLASPGATPDRTVPVERPVTVRHLLTMSAGFGWTGESPALVEAMSARGIAPGPFAPTIPPEEYLVRLAGLPLAGQPGRGWWYHTSSDVLGVLLARAADRPVGVLLEELVTGPLGLVDTGVTADPDRMPTSYGVGADGAPDPLDTVSRFAGRPVFESLACGLASTVGDHLTFLDVLVDGGPVLKPGTAWEMTRDHLTARQREQARGFLGPGCGYGFQVEVTPGGAVGWAGGLGTIGYVDRHTGRAAAVFTPQSFDVPGTPRALEQVWSLLG